jgi:hypothetical protein
MIIPAVCEACRGKYLRGVLEGVNLCKGCLYHLIDNMQEAYIAEYWTPIHAQDALEA